jgi:hypothetical protein
MKNNRLNDKSSSKLIASVDNDKLREADFSHNSVKSLSIGNLIRKVEANGLKRITLEGVRLTNELAIMLLETITDYS